MKKLLAFIRLKPQEKWLFMLSFLLLGLAKLSIKTLPFKWVSKGFGVKLNANQSTSPQITNQQKKRVIRLYKMIKLAAIYTPWNSNCLPQAMVARIYCAMYKIPYKFFIGVERSTSSKGLNLHAWVMTGPIALTGGNCFKTHTILLSYSN